MFTVAHTRKAAPLLLRHREQWQAHTRRGSVAAFTANRTAPHRQPPPCGWLYVRCGLRGAVYGRCCWRGAEAEPAALADPAGASRAMTPSTTPWGSGRPSAKRRGRASTIQGLRSVPSTLGGRDVRVGPPPEAVGRLSSWGSCKYAYAPYLSLRCASILATPGSSDGAAVRLAGQEASAGDDVEPAAPAHPPVDDVCRCDRTATPPPAARGAVPGPVSAWERVGSGFTPTMPPALPPAELATAPDGGQEAPRQAAGVSSPPAPHNQALPRGTALVWLRRDLRLDDNPALTAALKTGGTVVRVARFPGGQAAPPAQWRPALVVPRNGAPSCFLALPDPPSPWRRSQRRWSASSGPPTRRASLSRAGATAGGSTTP